MKKYDEVRDAYYDVIECFDDFENICDGYENAIADFYSYLEYFESECLKFKYLTDDNCVDLKSAIEFNDHAKDLFYFTANNYFFADREYSEAKKLSEKVNYFFSLYENVNQNNRELKNKALDIEKRCASSFCISFIIKIAENISDKVYKISDHAYKVVEKLNKYNNYKGEEIIDEDITVDDSTFAEINGMLNYSYSIDGTSHVNSKLNDEDIDVFTFARLLEEI